MSDEQYEKALEKSIDETIPHLKDILRECRIEKDTDGYWKGDLEQIKHNVFEIAKHLGINTKELNSED